MAVKSSGTLALGGDIAEEFNDEQPNSLSEFYRGGSAGVSAGANPNVPASGAIDFSDMYGAIGATVLTISSNTNNYDIAGAVQSAGGDLNTPVLLTVNSGVTVGSTSAGTPAMYTNTGWGSGVEITITNNGSIVGASGQAATVNPGSGGGNGGTGIGGLFSGCTGRPGSAGSAGSGSAQSNANGGAAFTHSQTANNNMAVVFATAGTRTGGSAAQTTFTGNGGGGGGGGSARAPVGGGYHQGMGGGGGGGANGGSGADPSGSAFADSGGQAAGTGQNGGATQGGAGGAGTNMANTSTPGSHAGAGGPGGDLGQAGSSGSGANCAGGGPGGSAGATNTAGGSAGQALAGNTNQISQEIKMAVTARRISGNEFTPDDIIEVSVDYPGIMVTCDQRIEVVSGPEVTHGGGAASSEYLHYKNPAVDADDDGNIDYHSSIMHVTQVSKGTSVIKVEIAYVKKDEHDSHATLFDAWKAENCETWGDLIFCKEGITWDMAPAYPAKTVEKSGEITLKWGDDSFV